MKKLMIGALAVLLLGCDQLMPEKSGDQKKSGAADAVDTVVIQRGKLEAGQRAAKKIKQINADRENDLKAVVGE